MQKDCMYNVDYHLINILIPCTLMSGLILLVFKLPAESGEKTGLGITILLSFSVFLLMIAESLPRTSESLPIIGFYLTFLLLSSSGSLLLTVMTLSMHHASADVAVPRSLRRVLKVLSVVTFCQPPRYTYRHSRVSTVVESNNSKWSYGANVVTHSLDREGGKPAPRSNRKSPYFMDFTSSPITQSPKLPPAVLTLSVQEAIARQRLLSEAMLATEIALRLDDPPPLPERNVPPAGTTDNSRQILTEYVEHLHMKLKKLEKEDEIRSEWKECSICLDRIAFRIFGFIIGSSSFVMCIGLPVVLELSSPKNHW